jgi:hypothetical protein
MRILALGLVFLTFCRAAFATQADDTVITITGNTAGATPFLSQLSLAVSDTSAVKSVQFTIAPKPGSSTRALSATYSNTYLSQRGDIVNGTIFVSIYGLYADYTNSVTLTYVFNDGSSKQAGTTITTTTFDDSCDYQSPTILQSRLAGNSLSYDYILLKGSCSNYSPEIIDTDGAIRWVGTAALASYDAALFENSIYIGHGSLIFRNDLDGTVTQLNDLASEGVEDFHHNVDRGKFGLIFEVDTHAYLETIFMEIDKDGTLLKTWNMADIISAAMAAGGDDPTKFVFGSPSDWFHNNSVAYNRADDSLIISSREDFVICIDYTTNAIKWILGDPTKAWYQFPSLQQYALTLASGSLPPIGQHAVSITYDQDLLLLDNGLNSYFQQPHGALRDYASPRKYHIDLNTMTATEVWNYPMDESVNSPYCGSVYEDSPSNYLVDYSYVTIDPNGQRYARILGLDAVGTKIFDYQYPTAGCTKIFNAVPVHFERTVFPAIGPQSLNLSSRGLVEPDQGSLIAGFIVTGSTAKTVVLRALGPSLANDGVSGAITDPVISLYDSSGHLITWNDNWQTDANHTQLAADGLAPANPAEAALRLVLQPGVYTAVVSARDTTPGLALVEIYDLSPTSDSKLANISTRALVGTEDDVLISGFIVGQIENSTVVLRALGPSLASTGIDQPLADPTLSVYDENGTTLITNNNWHDDPNFFYIEQNQLAPTNDAESATILHLPAGSYTAIAQDFNGETGVGLIEVYNLE